MRTFAVIFTLLFHVIGSNAQEKKAASHTLRPVSVRGQITWSHYNASIQRIDTATLKQYHQQSLRDLLQWNTHAVIKNYGVSGLSTMSLRGSSSAQTNIVWNGLNLNNAATGITDLSLMPVALFDEVKLEYNSTISVGGALYLNNLSGEMGKGVSIRCGIGYESLRNISVVAIQRSGMKKCMIENKVYVIHANNQFKYYNDNLKYISKNEHAHHFSSGFMNNVRVSLSSTKKLEIHNWYQITHRELPATLYELSSVKNESIATLRSNIRFSSFKRKNASSLFQLGCILDRYLYSDSTVNLSTNIQSLQIPFSAEYKWFLRKNVNLGIQWIGHYSQLLHEKDSYLIRSGFRIQADYILPGTVEWRNYLQKERSHPFTLPLIYGSSFSIKLYRGFFLFANANKQYRSPTLNELFYRPGGNRNLLPETSDNMEGGFRFLQKGNDFKWESHICTYLRSVSNWIVWYGNSIFTPHNVLKVLSRGVEWSATAEKILKGTDTREDLQHKDILLNASFFYSCNLATTVQSNVMSDYSTGKQLPYMPRYQLKYSFKAGTKNFFMQYYRTYTGYRFTTTDESEYLSPYSIHNLALMQKFRLLKSGMECYFNAENILNTAYQGMRGRMMPGRNAKVSLLITL